MPETPLAEERKYYESHKPELLKRYENQYVLIKRSELIGAFPDAQSAYVAGLERFGLEAFFVKQVLEREPVFYFPMLSVAPVDAGL